MTKPKDAHSEMAEIEKLKRQEKLRSRSLREARRHSISVKLKKLNKHLFGETPLHEREVERLIIYTLEHLFDTANELQDQLDMATTIKGVPDQTEGTPKGECVGTFLSETDEDKHNLGRNDDPLELWLKRVHEMDKLTERAQRILLISVDRAIQETDKSREEYHVWSIRNAVDLVQQISDGFDLMVKWHNQRSARITAENVEKLNEETTP